MRRFKSPGQAQRLFSIHGVIKISSGWAGTSCGLLITGCLGNVRSVSGRR